MTSLIHIIWPFLTLFPFRRPQSKRSNAFKYLKNSISIKLALLSQSFYCYMFTYVYMCAETGK